MKNTIILFALLFVPILGLKAQKKELENIFQQYEKTEGVTSINITKPMFGFLKALDIEDSEISQIKPVLSKLNGLKIIIIEDEGKNPSLKGVSSSILNAVNKLNYQELMTVNNQNAKMKFLAADAKDGMIDNLLMNITGSSGGSILMMLDGNLSMEDVNNLANESQLNSSSKKIKNDYSNRSNKEERTLGKFSGIRIASGIKVNFTQTPTQRITVETDPGKLKHIKTNIENGVLNISIDNLGERNLNLNKILVTVDAPTLNSITATSGSNFTTLNRITSDKFDVEVTSGASLFAELAAQKSANVKATSGSTSKIDIQSPYLNYDGSSASTVTLIGKVTNADMETSSATSLNAENLSLAKLTIKSSSASTAKVSVSETLDAKASSSATIRYFGNPKNTNVDVSSSGSVKNMK